MKCILFCQNNYAFGILEPIKVYLDKKKYDFLWYVSDKIIQDFPYKTEHYTSSISDLVNFQSDAIFVPGNEVPHYLRGLKVQIFHGLAGENIVALCSNLFTKIDFCSFSVGTDKVLIQK